MSEKRMSLGQAINERIESEVANRTGAIISQTDGVLGRPGPDAPKNPDYVPGSESPGTSAGTSSPEETEASGQISSGDPGLPEPR